MEPTTVSLPWLDIAQLVLGTGFVAAAINQAASWVRELRKEASATKREAKYLALRVAVTLERFAIDSAVLISDNTMHAQTAGQLGRIRTQLPDLLPYPKDVDWKSLDADLSSQALSLRNEHSISNEHISAALEIDPGAGVLECNRQAGLRGFRAWNLASNMRRKHSLPNFDPRETAWDLVGTLNAEHDAALEALQR